MPSVLNIIENEHGSDGDLTCPRTRNVLLKLLGYLEDIQYRFVTPTPATHARVLRRHRFGISIEDILGWSASFIPGSVDANVEQCLADANMLSTDVNGYLRSLIRVSTINDIPFLHSAYPTTDTDAVFFGPDSYRFADFIQAELAKVPWKYGQMIIDIGAGAGVGAIIAARLSRGANIVMTDINPKALAFARINAEYAGFKVETRLGSDLAGHQEGADLVIANPPYIYNSDGPMYRNGGADYGAETSLRMTRAALNVLRPGGRFLLYTGSAIVRGCDNLRDGLTSLADQHGLMFSYRELDPDVFGEELDNPGYEIVERIAVVGATFTRSSG